MNHLKAYIYSKNPLDSANGKWDYGLLKQTFERNKIDQVVVDTLPQEQRAFVVIPGKGNAGKEKDINNELNNINRVVLFITGDEENLFDVDQITHSNISIWVQYPTKKHQKYNKLPIGAPQHIKDNLPEYSEKPYTACFAGQITHRRRQQLANIMPDIKNSIYKPTDGFAKGLTAKEYYKDLFSAKIAPAPAGVVSVDSFRFFEAIEMLCMPIADLRDSNGNKNNFYHYVFDEVPIFPSTNNWAELPDIIKSILKEYPNNMHRVVAWWIKYKRNFAIKLMKEIYA
jgi:hypothetical protein